MFQVHTTEDNYLCVLPAPVFLLITVSKTISLIFSIVYIPITKIMDGGRGLV